MSASSPFCPAITFYSGAPPVNEYRPASDGRFHSGLWECAVGKWLVVFTQSEFCHLLAGVIVVTGDDGSQRTIRAGDALISPAGFTGWWEVRETARKYYAIYE